MHRTDSGADGGTVRELHVVALSEDGRHLVLATRAGTASGEFRVALDERLTAAVRGELPAPGRDAAPSISPRDIQARLRDGESPEQIAAAAGVPLSRVQRYAGPVLAELDRMITGARAGLVHRPRLGPSGLPLGEAVEAHLAEVAHLAEDSVRWSARRSDLGRWVVQVSWTARGRRRTAGWSYDPATREVAAVDGPSAVLGHVEADPEVGAARGSRPAAVAPPLTARAAGRAGSAPSAPRTSSATAAGRAVRAPAAPARTGGAASRAEAGPARSAAAGTSGGRATGRATTAESRTARSTGDASSSAGRAAPTSRTATRGTATSSATSARPASTGATTARTATSGTATARTATSGAATSGTPTPRKDASRAASRTGAPRPATSRTAATRTTATRTTATNPTASRTATPRPAPARPAPARPARARPAPAAAAATPAAEARTPATPTPRRTSPRRSAVPPLDDLSAAAIASEPSTALSTAPPTKPPTKPSTRPSTAPPTPAAPRPPVQAPVLPGPPVLRVVPPADPEPEAAEDTETTEETGATEDTAPAEARPARRAAGQRGGGRDWADVLMGGAPGPPATDPRQD